MSRAYCFHTSLRFVLSVRPTFYVLSNMSFWKRLLSPFLCCFGAHAREENATSDLQTLPSALHLPASQIPHATGQSRSNRNDTDALCQVFRSSSSIRGYRTASIPSGSHVQRESSFENDFKFGAEEQPRKQPSRLEQLGNHIKQKLSGSGLRNSDSRSHLASEEHGSNTVHAHKNHLEIVYPDISLSQRSTGLVDLLQSRTASEGGYDSDAKSIQTAMLNSREGTMRLSPTRAQTLLSPTSALRHVTTDGAPPSPERRQSNHKGLLLQMELGTLTSHQSRLSSTRVLEEAKSDSPIHVLQRLNAGVENGTIKLPDVPNSTRLPASAGFETSEQDPFTAASAPIEDLPMALQDTEFTDILKKLGNTVTAAKRESLITNGTDPRASLVSNLDPGLLDFISKYGESPPAKVAQQAFDENIVKGKTRAELGTVEKSRSIRPLMSARENTSKRDLTSLAESDRSSVHLYNMRISQRLGSPSFTAAPTRPNTSHTTTHPLRQNSTGARPSFDRTSTSGNIAGHIKTEHNRRPSDPSTRRLFEGDRNTSRPLSARINSTSPESSATNKKPRPLVDSADASSFYWSDGEVESNGSSRLFATKRNPNSVAVGGRSESISLPIGSSAGSLSAAEESAWFSRRPSHSKRELEPYSPIDSSLKRNRSVSAPGRNTNRPRPSFTLSSRQGQHPTEENEAMSIMSVAQLQDARREQMTEISIQAIRDARDEQITDIGAQAIRDARNERMSEVGPLDRSHETDNQPELNSFWSNTEPSTFGPKLSVGGRRSVSDNHEATESTLSAQPMFRGTATNVWQRSFKQAFGEPQNDSLGGFLTAPRFDRDGRRRSTRSSISALQPPHEHRHSEADIDPLESRQQHDLPQVKDKSLLDVCMRKPEPLPSVNPRRSIGFIDTRKQSVNTLGPTKTSRKQSPLDIGRRFSVIGGSREAERASGASTPLKDILGLWGRFASHTREDRSGPAGAKDGVAVRDFALECQDENTPTCSARHTRPSTALEMYTPGSWKMLSFGKKSRHGKHRMKSASSLHAGRASKSLRVRPKKSRKGLATRWKKLYRTSSMEIQVYTHNYGHRSSISVGASVEYPELEIVGGSAGWRSHFDGTTDIDHHHHQREEAGRAHDPLSQPSQPLDSASWTQTYRDCVGSLSPLKSDPELRQLSLDEEPQPSQHQQVTLSGSSADLRDSTVDFVSQLGKESEAAKEGLLRKVESMNPVQA